MSNALGAVDLSKAAVGTSGRLAWSRNDVQSGGATGLGAGKAMIRLYNESGCGLQIVFANGQSDRCAAGQWHVYPIPDGSLYLAWTVEYILPGANVALLLATVYAPGEVVPIAPTLGNSPVGVGGAVQTTGTTSVINDGQAAPTEVVEATPQGAGAPQLRWNNDGSGVFGGGNDVVNAAGLFTAMPADAIPAAAIAGGTLDSDVLVPEGNVGSGYPAASLGAGTLPAGVVVPEGNVSSGYPAASLGAGTLPAGVVVPGAQVTGDVANAANATTAGALAAGGALDGSATIPRGDRIQDASDANTQIGVAGDGSAQIRSVSHETLITSDVRTRLRFNAARAAAGGDTYEDSVNPAIDWFLDPTQEHWFQHRYAAPGVAGNAIPWGGGGFTMIQQGISGSASATVSHGLGFAPWAAIVNTFNGSNSTTFGSGSYTSSSVYIFEFNSQSWRGFVCA